MLLRGGTAKTGKIAAVWDILFLFSPKLGWGAVKPMVIAAIWNHLFLIPGWVGGCKVEGACCCMKQLVFLVLSWMGRGLCRSMANFVKAGVVARG